MLLINCQINFMLNCSASCVITSSTDAGTVAITDTKLYAPVVTVSFQDNTKILYKLKSGFKRTIKHS